MIVGAEKSPLFLAQRKEEEEGGGKEEEEFFAFDVGMRHQPLTGAPCRERRESVTQRKRPHQ